VEEYSIVDTGLRKGRKWENKTTRKDWIARINRAMTAKKKEL